MQIAQILDNIVTLGPKVRGCVWVSGCKRSCTGCISPQFRDFSFGVNMSADDIVRQVRGHDGITISGGEPFEQAAELYLLVLALNQSGIRDILVFTGYTLAELKARNCASTNGILDNIAALVAGEYILKLDDNKHKLLGSLNQQLIVLRKEFEKAYTEYCNDVRRSQIVLTASGVTAVGIPQASTKQSTRKITKQILKNLSNSKKS